MQDNCYTYMHALYYSYGMMQCINRIVHLGVVSINAKMRGNERVPCVGTNEAIYLSVLDFEYRT